MFPTRVAPTVPPSAPLSLACVFFWRLASFEAPAVCEVGPTFHEFKIIFRVRLGAIMLGVQWTPSFRWFPLGLV